MVPGTGSSVGPGTGAVGLEGPRSVAVTLSTREKDVTQGIRSAGLPDKIPPAGSKWALFPPHVPTGRSQNTVPIASTQVAIKGTVQYST